MSKIQEIFNFYCQQPSDINQHLPTLKRYSDQCEVVVEMGGFDILIKGKENG